MSFMNGLSSNRISTSPAPQLGDDLLNPKARSRAARASEASKNSSRRRLVDPTTCDRDYSVEEIEFMQAMSDYKQSSGRMFPTWSETLEVLQGLGYTKSGE